MATTTRPSWIAAAERRLAGAPDVVEEAPRPASAAAPPSPRVPETAAPVVTAAALEAEYEAALAAASAVNNDDGDASAVNNAADRVAAAAHRRRGAQAAFLTGLGEEPDHELYPNYQHERRLRRAAGESDEAWEKRMLAGSPTRGRVKHTELLSSMHDAVWRPSCRVGALPPEGRLVEAEAIGDSCARDLRLPMAVDGAAGVRAARVPAVPGRVPSRWARGRQRDVRTVIVLGQDQEAEPAREVFLPLIPQHFLVTLAHVRVPLRSQPVGRAQEPRFDQRGLGEA